MQARPNRCVALQKLVIATSHRLSRAVKLLSSQALPAGDPYYRPASTWLEIRSLVVQGLAPVAILVMWGRLVLVFVSV